MLWPSVIESFPRILGPEGTKQCMYLDTKGLVTTGKGNLIDTVKDAQALPWKDSQDGFKLASDESIEEEWKSVKARQDMKTARSSYWDTVTRLRLSYADIDELVTNKLKSNGNILSVRIPAFGRFPADAQMAISRWAWAVGAGANFPRFLEALRAVIPDFLAAFAASRWENRPKMDESAMSLLFSNAQAVLAAGADPSIVYWPSAYSTGASANSQRATNGVFILAALGGLGYAAYRFFPPPLPMVEKG